jgi:hemerythrin-like domain-containing protein
MDALELLANDHRVMKKVLEDLEGTDDAGQREKLFTEAGRDLTIHETIEEEIFYPALREHAKTKEIALEAYEEHHVVDLVMEELEATPFADETWEAKFKVMKENIEHHIEEEENEMFAHARQVFDTSQLAELGERMQARKTELQSSAA